MQKVYVTEEQREKFIEKVNRDVEVGCCDSVGPQGGSAGSKEKHSQIPTFDDHEILKLESLKRPRPHRKDGALTVCVVSRQIDFLGLIIMTDCWWHRWSRRFGLGNL